MKTERTFTDAELLAKELFQSRALMCAGCSCNVDFSSPCAECPNKQWGPYKCKPDPHAPNPNGGDQNKSLPSALQMAKSAMAAAVDWAVHGFAHTDQETLLSRYQICEGCEYWNATGFSNSGRCMKCGCSTWAKLRMATEKCPIGKW